MTHKTLIALGAGSIAMLASMQAPFGFGHRPRFLFAPEGEGGGGDVGAAAAAADDVSVDSALAEAFAEVTAGIGADTETQGEFAKGRAQPEATVPGAQAEAAPTDKPEHWSANEQAQFDALAPETKALVEKRIAAIEADYTAKNGDKVKLADEIDAVVDADMRGRMQASGMSLPQGVQYLANLERFANDKPADYLRFVAEHVQKAGIDVAKVLGFDGQPAPAAAPAGDDAFTDPRVTQLEERLANYERQGAETQRQRVLDDAGRTIATFRDAKDASGNLLRPHMADVENDMAALVRGNPKITLEEAYDAAVWGNPTVRAKLMAADKEAADKKARDEAATAQRAARSNVRPGQRSMSQNQPVDSVDDAVSQAFAEINR